jgi:Outer membrane protein beta-barrel domain
MEVCRFPGDLTTINPFAVQGESMLSAVFAAALLTAGPSVVAQSGGYGYVFAAPGQLRCCGASQGTWHLGGGGEMVTPSGVGVGAEMGFLGPRDTFSDGIGTLSIDGSYHFRVQGSRRVSPFAAGGYSLFFRDGHFNLFNYGGGIQYELSPRTGLLVEFRDHVHSEQSVTAHYWGVRFGVTFR